MSTSTSIYCLSALLAIGLAAECTAAEAGKLLVWVNKDKCFDAWTRTAEQYGKQTGVAVKVEATIPDFFHNAAAVGKGPDIVVWAHDILGRWVADGLLQPVTPSQRVKDAIDPQGWQAFSLGRKYWGYPIGIEAIHLIYNKRYVSTPPQSFEDIAQLDRKLASSNRKAILWDLSHIYYSWPLFAANGAYAFKPREEGWNPNDVGVANAGAQKGAAALQRLIKDGVLPAGANRDEAESAFLEGRVAMTIDGPWVWDKLKDAGIDFGTAAIPRTGGKPGAPFVGVTGAMLSRASPNKRLATEFIENALLKPEALKACNADKSLGVPADLKVRAELASDPHVRGMTEAARYGAPMPNNPEMTYFWGPMETALEAIIDGRKTPADALTAAAKRIRER
ncbi:maltose/maltodextrin ABC transporter substrate-binding protein MalE [Niveibacterium umoris]|uniref:Maltodextrin-binding protein n=1 Tax=Niveibacterium umoris TaxID=1193620 RepID=A0A840BQM9_9RHOO|nr:maltose/maltodextrin ABC transporter substrate-binding protein MalE [Niveibacterium umoris]MBB4013126.1 maltose/maltodextrin transport system substrate-binding protein [Niveibacterium umoris]